jgi:hypothetical protein
VLLKGIYHRAVAGTTEQKLSWLGFFHPLTGPAGPFLGSRSDDLMSVG